MPTSGCGRTDEDEERNDSGSARKRSRHPGQQKKYVCPPCATWAAAVAGSIIIPQTGSRTVGPGLSVIMSI
jgi:hypothetical protein